MHFACAVAMSARFGMDLDLAKLSESDKAVCAGAISAYKQIREVVHLGDLYRIEQPQKNIPVTIHARRLLYPVRAEYWNPLQPKPTLLKLTRSGNELQLTVPQVDIYGLVVITGATL